MNKEINENKKLLLAAESGDIKEIESALESGAYVNIRNPKGLSPLHLAIIHNNVKAVKKLIEQENINLNISDKYGYSVLHEAVKRKSPEIVKLLIDHGAEIKILNNDDQTPKQLAESYLKWLPSPNHNEDYKKIIEIFDNYNAKKIEQATKESTEIIIDNKNPQS